MAEKNDSKYDKLKVYFDKKLKDIKKYTRAQRIGLKKIKIKFKKMNEEKSDANIVETIKKIFSDKLLKKLDSPKIIEKDNLEDGETEVIKKESDKQNRKTAADAKRRLKATIENDKKKIKEEAESKSEENTNIQEDTKEDEEKQEEDSLASGENLEIGL